ncbi:MAG TPA: isochorismatase family protein [Candidatus Tumulicola sp.]
MPVTQLDPVAALVLIDLQKGIVSRPTAHPASEIVERCAALARAFRERSLPVILVNVAGQPAARTDAATSFSPPPDWTELVPELQPQPGDELITKMQIGAFYGTALERILRRRAATQIFFGGIATSIGVESTVRTAYDHGFNVVTVVDAMTDLNEQSHQHSVERIFPRLSQTATTADVLSLLQG